MPSTRSALAIVTLAYAISGCNAVTGADDLELEGPAAEAAQGAGGGAHATSAGGATGGPGSSTTGMGGNTSGSANGGATAAASGGAGPAASAAASVAASSAAAGGGDDVAQLCVDTINQYRASLGLPPYGRWMDAEVCADGQADSDSQTGTPHGAFGQCGEFAQNECPGWSGPPENMIGPCLELMWMEGPGDDFPTHGHYINMTSMQYTMVACGFHTLPNGKVWAVQDFH